MSWDFGPFCSHFHLSLCIFLNFLFNFLTHLWAFLTRRGRNQEQKAAGRSQQRCPDKSSNTQRNEVPTAAMTWMNPQNVMSCEGRQTANNPYCMIPISELSRISKFTETESKLVVARDWGEGCGGTGHDRLMGMRFPLGWWKCSGTS